MNAPMTLLSILFVNSVDLKRNLISLKIILPTVQSGDFGVVGT